MVHVWRHHEYRASLLLGFITSLNGHVTQPDDVRMGQHLENLDFAQGCDGELFFVVQYRISHAIAWLPLPRPFRYA